MTDFAIRNDKIEPIVINARTNPDNSYKIGKNLNRDISHCSKMLNDVQKKIQDLHLPSQINPLSQNPQINRDLYQAKKFLDNMQQNYDEKDLKEHQFQLMSLRRRVMSAKLGGQITPQMLADNPDYEKFIQGTSWHNAAVRYNHVLPVVDGKPGVIYDGKAISYSQLASFPYLENHVHPTYWGYWIVKKGMVHHWAHNFKNMVPNDHDDPAKWGNQYAVEIMTSLKDANEEDPKGAGDHSWLRLKTPQGDIYSFGIYGPKSTCKDKICNRYRIVMGGCADSPDRYETMDQNENHFHGTTVAITEDQFKKLQEEMFEISKKGVPFSPLKTNCTGHVKRLLDKVGIQIESHLALSEFIAPKLFPKKVRHFYDKIVPGFIKAVFNCIGRFFQGLALLVMRTGSRHEDVKKAWGEEFKVDIPNFFDKFKTVHMEHPLALRKWQRKVDGWREKKISKLAQKKIILANKKLELEKAISEDNPLKEKIVTVEKQLNEIDVKIKAIPFALPNK